MPPLADLASDLVVFRRPATWRKRVLFFALLAGLAVAGSRQLLVDQVESTDGHAILALDLALTRRFCGAASALALRYGIPQYVQTHPDARFRPLRDLIVEQAGSVDGYC